MRKPKYYLKPWRRGLYTPGIPKLNWNRIRLRNNKPKLSSDSKNWYDLDLWNIPKQSMTQRFFIEEKEAQND